MVSEVRGPEDAFEPVGGPKVSKSISFLIENYMKFAPSQTSGFACHMHFCAVNIVQWIKSRSVEQYSVVRMSLHVTYWSGFLLG